VHRLLVLDRCFGEAYRALAGMLATTSVGQLEGIRGQVERKLQRVGGERVLAGVVGTLETGAQVGVEGYLTERGCRLGVSIRARVMNPPGDLLDGVIAWTQNFSLPQGAHTDSLAAATLEE
jgi:hypothetical protein